MIGYSKRIEEIIGESTFDKYEEKQKPWLKFNPVFALTGPGEFLLANQSQNGTNTMITYFPYIFKEHLTEGKIRILS